MTATPRALRRSRPVVLGADGRAGAAVAEALSAHAPQTVAAGRIEIDVCDYFQMCWELERLEADLVINAVGWADVDGCEADPVRSRLLHAEAAGQMAWAARGAGAGFVHLSSDYVFDGAGGAPYDEAAEPNPLSVYGRDKREGELLVLENHPEALILRTAWLFGGHGRRPDFVTRVLSAAHAGASIPVVSDQVGCPTGVDELARGLVDLLAVGATGLVHLAGAGGVSRADFARAIMDEEHRFDVEIEPVLSDSMTGRARRPPDSRLDTSLFTRLTGAPPRPWREGLREALARRRQEVAGL
jgi:dTDP-4-dehydrorhamnose reductase